MHLVVRITTALLMVAAASAPAMAGIVIQNSSFEAPNTASFSNVTPTNWTWNSTGGRGVVVEGASGAFPTTTDGDQWGFISGGGALAQNVGPAMVLPNFAYGYSFYQYEQTNISDNGSGIRIEIWSNNPFSGGTLLDSNEYAATGAGNMVQRSGTLTVGPAATAGSNLFLVLRAISDPGSSRSSNVGIDEIALTELGPTRSAVPEPATFALCGLGLGVAGLLNVRRKRPQTPR